ncbi:5-guanidino-2-oxopentanoate decarboxylase [Rhodovibrionaceae bacterium A322]
MTKPTCGQALVPLLQDYGIDQAFGIPGVHTIELYRGYENHGLPHVLCRHEQGAGFMADGYARVTGKPAACFLISGPGLTNTATPIATAYADSQPMLVIASTNLRREIGKGWGPFHELRNQRLIAEQFTGYAGQALSPQDIPEILAQAWASMTSGRPRPVYVEIPRDVLAEPAEGDWQAVKAAPRPVASPDDINRAADLLSQAERPLILVGAGAAEAAADLTALVDQVDAVVISSFCGKGVIAESHPNCLGAALSFDGARDLVHDADVVLAIGTELSTVDASNQTLSFSGKLIRIDIDPKKLTDRYRAHLPIVSDAGPAAKALSQRLQAVTDPKKHPAWQARMADSKKRFDQFGSAKSGEHRAVLSAITQASPDDCILVGDMTQLAYSANHFYRPDQPRQWLHPASYATLGFALPTAIGAKLGQPDKAVISLSGDCGFLFTCQEMATAAELKQPLVHILWNNAALGEIRDAMIGAQIAPVEVQGENPDFLAMARSFHWTAERARDLSHLSHLVAEGLERQGPTLIEVNEGIGDLS